MTDAVSADSAAHADHATNADSVVHTFAVDGSAMLECDELQFNAKRGGRR